LARHQSTDDADAVASSISTTFSYGPTFFIDLSVLHIMYILQVLSVASAGIGVLANAFVMLALCASTQQMGKQSVNVLFINQVSLDLFTSVCVVVIYSMKLANYPVYNSGYFVCVFIANDNLIWGGLAGSMVNLASVAVERYVKVVHPIWHTNKVRSWMIYLVAGIAWANGILVDMVNISANTSFVNGNCIVQGRSKTARLICNTWLFVFYIVIALVLIIYSYLRIVIAVRGRVDTFAKRHSNNPLAVTANEQSMRVQMNAVKTMIAISASYIAYWMPSCILEMWSLSNDNFKIGLYVYFVTILLMSTNVAVNPLIYVTKYEPVKKFCRRLISYRGLRAAAKPMPTINMVTVQSAAQ
jgi:hypothetical protein